MKVRLLILIFSSLSASGSWDSYSASKKARFPANFSPASYSFDKTGENFIGGNEVEKKYVIKYRPIGEAEARSVDLKVFLKDDMQENEYHKYFSDRVPDYVCVIYDSFVDSNSYYVVMEQLMPFTMIREYSPSLKLGLMLDMARAVLVLHSVRGPKGEKYVHSYINPENIMVTRDFKFPRAKLIELDLVSVVGTKIRGQNSAYAPETIEEEASQLTDIYSLGITFIEFLTGITSTRVQLENQNNINLLPLLYFLCDYCIDAIRMITYGMTAGPSKRFSLSLVIQVLTHIYRLQKTNESDSKHSGDYTIAQRIGDFVVKEEDSAAFVKNFVQHYRFI